MQTYKGRVNVGGLVVHDVPKDEMTASEIMILRHIHGQDCITALSKVRNDRRTIPDERTRLVKLYGLKTFESVIGAGYQPNMPKALPPTDVALKDDVEVPDSEIEAEVETETE